MIKCYIHIISTVADRWHRDDIMMSLWHQDDIMKSLWFRLSAGRSTRSYCGINTKNWDEGQDNYPPFHKIENLNRPAV